MANQLDDVLAAGETRKDALQNLFDAIAHPLLLSSAPRAKTLYAMLICLQHFGQKQLEFFLNGFGAEGLLDEHPLYSAEYALDVTHNQIGFDLDVILRAFHHRTHRVSPVSQAVTSMRKRLEHADLAAQAALQPAYDKGLLQQRATAITYYQKSPSVRAIPYAPVALIGIPFAAAAEPRDLASIAHEVGHFVFWRMPREDDSESQWPNKFGDQNYLMRSRRRLLGADPPRKVDLAVVDAWQEELFADIYGCLVAGPVAGLTMLEMVRRLPGTRWFEDDGEHPPPALRTIAYLATLERMASSAQGYALERICSAIEKLKAEQTHWLGSLPDWLTVHLRDRQVISVARLCEMVEGVVETYLAPDTGMLAGLLPHGEEVWPLWHEAPFNRAAQTVFSQDESAVELEALPADLRVTKQNGQITVKLEGEQDGWLAGATGQWLDWEQAREKNTDAIGVIKERGWDPWWLAVLSGGYWTTKGPGAGNPQPVD